MTKSLLCWLAVAALLAACKTPSSASFGSSTHPAVDLAGLPPGLIVIAPAALAASISVDPPNPRVERMSEGAADAARGFMNTSNLGNSQLEAAVGAVQFALSPFAAAYGAVSARGQQLSTSEMADAQQQLANAMRSNGAPDLLVQKVAEIARQKTRRLLLCFSSLSNTPPQDLPVSAVLEIEVNQLQLRASKPGANQYFLSADASARFVRNPDGKVLLQRSYHYESGPGFFFDWTRNGGLEGVADTGYRALAEQIAADVFEPVSAPPILISPQSKHSRLSPDRFEKEDSGRIRQSRRSDEAYAVPVCWRAHQMSLTTPGRAGVVTRHRPERLTGAVHRPHRLLWRAGASLPEKKPSLQFASMLQAEVGSMEIHTGKTDDRLRAPKPGPETGSLTGTMSDTEWAMDGLVEDRNAVVQGVSCVAAVPMGLWEQTVGIFHKRSQEKKDQYANTLRTAVTQTRLEGGLADQVTQCLQSQVIDPIRRTDEPLRLSLSTPGQASRAVSSSPVAPCKSALEIQVLNTRLLGKHRNSRSRAVCVEIQATVFRTSDGQELYSRPIRYQSSDKRLKDWAASDAKLFRQELDACTRRAAQALANDLIAQGFATPIQQTNSAIPNRAQ